MKLTPVSPSFLVAAAALLILPALVAAAPVPGADKDLKTQALELNDITGDDSIQGQITLLVANPDATRKLLTTALGMARQKDQPFNYTGLYILARTAQRLKEYDISVTFFKLGRDQADTLKSGAKLGQTFGGLIDLYYEQKKFDEAEKLCREFLDFDSNDSTVLLYKVQMLRRMIQALAKQEKFEEANTLVDRLVTTQPDNWLLLELKGWVQRESGKHDAAAKTYEDVLARVAKDKSLDEKVKNEFSEDLHYSLSNIYLELKKVDKVAEHLETLMKLDPDNPTWYNDLGFIWADNDQNLDKAEEYIRKALDLDQKQRAKLVKEKKLDPAEDHDNPAYLDSLGWVLFKKKKFKDAVSYLQKAVNFKQGHHIEIFDHLGDCHQALGEKVDAVAAWKKGVEVTGDTKREKDRKVAVEKKIKEAQ